MSSTPLTTKQIISPATSTREKRAFFLERRGSRIGTILVLNCQMSWHVILIFRIILISKRGYRSRLKVRQRENGDRFTIFRLCLTSLLFPCQTYNRSKSRRMLTWWSCNKVRSENLTVSANQEQYMQQLLQKAYSTSHVLPSKYNI